MLNENKVAIEELKNLKEMLEGFRDDSKAIHAETGIDWFNGRYGAYNIIIDYLQSRIDFLEKMALEWP